MLLNQKTESMAGCGDLVMESAWAASVSARRGSFAWLRALPQSKHARPEQPAIFAGLGAGDQELAVAAIMNGLWKFRGGRHMRLHHFEHEQIVLLHPAGIGKAAFEIGVAFIDQG